MIKLEFNNFEKKIYLWETSLLLLILTNINLSSL